MAEKQLQTIVELFRTHIRQQHWSIIGEKSVPHGIQLLLTDGQTRASVTCFTNGNALIQGAASPLRTQLQTWWDQQKTPSSPLKLEATPEKTPEGTMAPPFKAHIGMDEAGKGDYFGPLVVAGVFVDEQKAPQLRALGVRDSKTLSDTAILSLADEIKRLCSSRHYHLLSYQPAQYNQLYQQVQNLNLLLANAHAQVIQVLQEETGCHSVLVDQFDSSKILVAQALQDVGCQITLEQRTQAEDDVAVAAASILARAAFLQYLERLARDVRMSLPKGASHPDIVVIGKFLVSQSGQEMLGEVAKVHFKITQAILQEEKKFPTILP
jgi:ribonuclease HIII